MAGSATNYLEDARLNVIKGTTHPAAPATMYVGLFTAVTDIEAGTVTEVSGNNYARRSIASSDWTAIANTSTPDSAGRQITNASLLTFATPSGSWGTVTHWGLFDALTSGNMWYGGDLTASKTIDNGDTVTIAANALVIQER